jgi:hypothetical protein
VTRNRALYRVAAHRAPRGRTDQMLFEVRIFRKHPARVGREIQSKAPAPLADPGSTRNHPAQCGPGGLLGDGEVQTRTGSLTAASSVKISSVSGVRRAWTSPKRTRTAIIAASTKEQMAPIRAIWAKTENP